MEEMNARLVAHIRALQVELRKYMDFDKVVLLHSVALVL
jgi:hypothetical protein